MSIPHSVFVTDEVHVKSRKKVFTMLIFRFPTSEPFVSESLNEKSKNAKSTTKGYFFFSEGGVVRAKSGQMKLSARINSVRF